MEQNKEKTVTVHTNVSVRILENFDLRYARCRTRFIRNALELACKDKNFFDKVFFKDLLCNE